jgi:XTP/dITP diphosphohydrolase
MKPPTKIILATHNRGKVKEISALLSDADVLVESLREFPEFHLSEEIGSTYLENARAKANEVANYTKCWSLADDSGLEVEALWGKPGVHSARFAGKSASNEDNIQKLLKEIENKKNRKATFRCVLVLAHPDGREMIAEGELEGWISEKPRGNHGFGYDPIFLLTPDGPALAEISEEKKNRVSHRGRALKKLRKILSRLT